MRKTKWLLAGFLFLLCFFFGIALFLPPKVIVSKWIDIDAPASVVASQINDFDKWKSWYPAFQGKEISVSIINKQKNPLTYSAELFDKKGHRIIFNMFHPSMDTIAVEIQIDKKKFTDYQFIISNNNKGYTQLVWNVYTNLGWDPWKKIEGIIMDKITGPEYIVALQNLKTVVESKYFQAKPK